LRTEAIARLLAAGVVVFLAGCPLAHDKVDLGRSCDQDRDCPADEVCAAPDASVRVDGGRAAESLCYPRSALVPCFVDDAGVAAFYCFSSDQRCLHQPRTCLEWADAGCDQDAGCGDGGPSQDAGCVRWSPEHFGCEPGGGPNP